MNRRIVTRTLVIVFVATFFVNIVSMARAQDDNSCSLAGVAGKYAFTLTGSLLLSTGPVPAGAVGRATLDAAGNVSGTEARNVGGGYADETFTGAYTVNPNCTGAATLYFYDSGTLVRTSVLSLVFDDNMNEFRFVQKSLTLPSGSNLPVVLIGVGKRLFTQNQQ